MLSISVRHILPYSLILLSIFYFFQGELEARFSIDSESASILREKAADIPTEVLQLAKRRKTEGFKERKYSDAIRSFAISLHLFSPRAYR